MSVNVVIKNKTKMKVLCMLLIIAILIIFSIAILIGEDTSSTSVKKINNNIHNTW